MRRGIALAQTLIAIMLMGVLAVGLFYGSSMLGRAPGSPPPPSARPDGKGATIPGLVRLKAQDEVCRSNVQQVRQALQIANTTDDAYPASLADLKLGETLTKCAVGGEAYTYDPASGAVYCPHPGHEKF